MFEVSRATTLTNFGPAARMPTAKYRCEEWRRAWPTRAATACS